LLIYTHHSFQRGDAGTNPSHPALIRPGNEASPLNIASLPTLLAQLVLRTQASCKECALRAQPGRKEQRWFLPVSATLLRSYRCAVSRDERHCAVLTRSANAAARLLLRSQAERKAATLRVR